MKCGPVRVFLAQVNERDEPVTPLPAPDLDFLTSNGFVLRATKDDYDGGVAEVARLSQMVPQLGVERSEESQAEAAMRLDEQKEHSLTFHFESKEAREELVARTQQEEAAVSKMESELGATEASVNKLIEEKSRIDQMVPYDGGYVSLTGPGVVALRDLGVRIYRVADDEFADFLAEMKATDAELQSIASRAYSYVNQFRFTIPQTDDEVGRSSLLWGVGIGLAKLQGDTSQIGGRFVQALDAVRALDSTTPSQLMAAELLTAMGGDVQNLASVLKDLDKQVRGQDVPKELSAGVAATIMAGRRFDGSFPLDRFAQFKQLTLSYEAASIMAVMNVPYDGLSAKFNEFRATFSSWGYMKSEDTEIASAFLAIGELDSQEVGEKLKSIVEQLKNYLEYPLVGAAILASIPVYESHEVLDLMEKAVAMLSAFGWGLERSALVALAVRMVHGVRNELVKEIDPTARVSATPVQFTYGTHPGFFWYYPVIVAHSTYHATFSGMGGFHPAHSHGIGGFAG